MFGIIYLEERKIRHCERCDNAVTNADITLLVLSRNNSSISEIKEWRHRPYCRIDSYVPSK
jgi:hypothetical protein